MERLQIRPLPPQTRITHPAAHYPRIGLDDPATTVMTDLHHERPVIIRPQETLATAEKLMVNAGVRLLLVARDGGELAGLITYRDIIGEKAMTIATATRTPHDELGVGEVMTPANEIEALDRCAVERARVRELITLMRERGRQHALVIETVAADGSAQVCGTFSITRIGAQLGLKIDASGSIQSFAEIERLIAHN